MKKINKNKGVALITAMLITAITGSLAAGLTWNNSLDIRRTMTLMLHEQGIQVALGAETWVQNILQNDSLSNQTDHLGEIWASELPVLPIDNDSIQGAVSGKIEDLNGKFNVNNLVDANGQVNVDMLEQFERLLQILNLDIRFAGLTVDWIDIDQIASLPNGAEDPVYTSFNPPYRTSNRPLVNVTELSSLEGMDKLSFRKLLPHITALPGKTKINVNTATPEVLSSLSNNIDQSTLEGLLSLRKESGISDITSTFGTLIENKVIFDNLSQKSEYFQLKAVVQIDNVVVNYFSLIMRLPNGGPVTTILRSFGSI